MIDFIVGFIVGVTFGTQLGYFHREVRALLQKIHKPEPEPKTGVNYGAYAPVNENAAQKESSAIVEPKTPQLVEFEARQALEQENLNVRPRK